MVSFFNYEFQITNYDKGYQKWYPFFLLNCPKFVFTVVYIYVMGQRSKR